MSRFAFGNFLSAAAAAGETTTRVLMAPVRLKIKKAACGRR
jgi:hypothetical protein